MSQQNGQFPVQDKSGEKGPASSLDIYDEAVSPNAGGDEYLEEVNLGIGNYDDAEFWQQVESFRQGMYAEAAFSRKIVDRAIRKTKRELAKEEWERLDERKREKKSRRKYLREAAERNWEELSDKQRLAKLQKHTGLSKDWTPPFHRMMTMRNEASRSRGARLIDNLFGRVSVHEAKGDEEAKKQLLRLGGNR